MKMLGFTEDGSVRLGVLGAFADAAGAELNLIRAVSSVIHARTDARIDSARQVARMIAQLAPMVADMQRGLTAWLSVARANVEVLEVHEGLGRLRMRAAEAAPSMELFFNEHGPLLNAQDVHAVRSFLAWLASDPSRSPCEEFVQRLDADIQAQAEEAKRTAHDWQSVDGDGL